MKIVGIAEAKNRLSAFIDGLKGGARVLIVDRGRPVALLEPATEGNDHQDGRIARLVRDGVLRPGGMRLPASLATQQPPRIKNRASAVSALLEERRNGR
jgi:antitoxin (DNA-binding transcriptional repressor) of toxin-antitoxin stability system